MGEYNPIDSGVKVNGQTVLSVIEAFPESLKSKGRRILADNGIEEPREDEWYQQAAWLDAFEDLSEKMGDSTLERIGKEIPENAEWPPETGSIVDGIESIDSAYNMNHKGGEIGSYSAEQTDETRVEVECDNPYPCAFDVGIIKGVISEFGDKRARVSEVGSSCREQGSGSCEYEVSW